MIMAVSGDNRFRHAGINQNFFGWGDDEPGNRRDVNHFTYVDSLSKSFTFIAMNGAGFERDNTVHVFYFMIFVL